MTLLADALAAVRAHDEAWAELRDRHRAEEEALRAEGEALRARLDTLQMEADAAFPQVLLRWGLGGAPTRHVIIRRTEHSCWLRLAGATRAEVVRFQRGWGDRYREYGRGDRGWSFHEKDIVQPDAQREDP